MAVPVVSASTVPVLPPAFVSSPPTDFKTYSIELYFDPTAVDKIRQLWDRARAIAPSMAPQLHAQPHISLAVISGRPGDRDRLARLPDLLSRLAGRESHFPVQFSSIGVFPTQESVVFLAPVISDTLLRLHQHCHEALRTADLESSPYYRPGSWVPHCTIARQLDPAEVLPVIDVVRNSETFLTADICEIGLVEAPPVRRVGVFPLQANSNPPSLGKPDA